MKTTISLGVALLALTSVQAQIFRPEAGRNAGPRVSQGGAEANASSRSGSPVRRGDGEGSRHDAGGHGRDGRGSGYHGNDYYRGGRPYYGYRPSYSYLPAYRYYPGYDYTYGYYGGYGDGYPYYGGYYLAGSGAASGVLLGALAGGIIGNNSGDFRHSGWRGAAWGAGAGWLLGSIVDANRRPAVYNSPPAASAPAPAVPTPAQPAAAPVTIINNYYNSATPMSAANGMFGR